MSPYSKLSDADKNKDALVVRFIPLFLALEGLRIKSKRLSEQGARNEIH
jgi:hypothetical protein